MNPLAEAWYAKSVQELPAWGQALFVFLLIVIAYYVWDRR